MGLPEVKSCARVFDILELFAQVRHPLRLKEIAASLQYPTSSAAALVKSMTARGYLSYDSQSKSYLPTARLALLLDWIPGNSFEQVVVLQCMRRLQKETDESVVLGTVEHIHLKYVESLRASHPMHLYVAPGTTRPLVLNGAGWMLLSRGSRDTALATYRSSVQAGIVDPLKFPESVFLEHLASHRTITTCYNRARDLLITTAHWGGGMVYGLIPVPYGHRQLVVGVAGLTDRLEAKRALIDRSLDTCRAALQQAISDDVASTGRLSAPRGGG